MADNAQLYYLNIEMKKGFKGWTDGGLKFLLRYNWLTVKLRKSILNSIKKGE